MVFGISYGEILVILGAGAICFGTKDLPVLARSAGLVTGRAAAYLSSARSKFLGFAEQNEVTKLHQEVQESLSQLQAIRAELRGGINLFNPGPVASRLLRQSAAPAHSTAQATSRAEDSAANTPHAPSPAPSFDSGSNSSEEVLAAASASTYQARQHQQQHPTPHPATLQPLPVSAVAAGRARVRTGLSTSGSDIMADALAEEEVARAAQRFMEGQQRTS